MNGLLLLLGISLIPGYPPSDKDKVDFAREIRPILANYCLACHGPDAKARKAGLRLDQFAGATRDLGDRAQAIQPGDPARSLLVHRLEDTEPTRIMPPPAFGKRPSGVEIKKLKQWILEGGQYTRHWAHVAPVRPLPPGEPDAQWSKQSLDRFVLAGMREQGLAPAQRAASLVILRRASLDLTGLPPSPAEADAFARDTRPDAYERAVDSMLEKPAYGERWASVWLDLARYGDSVGYTHDPPRTIWRWRDWLIGALNANMPYDRLTVEMLAGDLLPGATPEQMIASGFNRNTTTNTEGGSNAEEYHFAAVADRVNTTMQVWTGSTFACAQCHSHKYDPFSQKEYYQIFSIFNNTADFNSEAPTLVVARVGMEKEFGALKGSLEKARILLAAETTQADGLAPAWEKTLSSGNGPAGALPAAVASVLQLSASKRSKAQADLLLAHHRGLVKAWVAADAGVRRLTAEFDQVSATTLIMAEIKPRETFVALRGDFRNRGDRVAAGVPAEFPPLAPGLPANRLGFAKWLVDPAHPLTARVAVNRLWQEIFGLGLVDTSEEFGSQGNPPSHPELLDWLATEYIRLGWDTKRFLRMVVTSETYRQISEASPESFSKDPQNRFLSRGPRFRLPAEAIRDQALAAAGLLSSRMYGPPAQPFQVANGLVAAFGQSTDWEAGKGEESHRRAIYTRWRRNLPYPSMLSFDVPERAVCSMRRIRTNTPLQALVTLNDPVFFEAAQGLGRRMALASGSLENKLEYGFRLVLVRQPAREELTRLALLFSTTKTRLGGQPGQASSIATKPIGPLPAGLPAVEAAAFTLVGNALLNLDETLMKR